MSLFDKHIVENAVSEKELCMMDPVYFVSKYVATKSKTHKEELSALERECIRLNISEEECKQIISKFVRSLW
jgi:hypothetical protein